MSELQQNRYDQLVRRVGGLIGPGSKVSEVISELFPMFDVENLPAELFVLGGTALAFRSTNVVAPAGAENASQLSNPAGSGKVLTVTQLLVSSDADAIVNMSTNPALLVSLNGFGEFRDSRNVGPVPSAAVGTTRIQTGLIINAGTTFTVLANDTISIRDDNAVAVLLPGDQLTLGIVTLQQRLIVTYFWRERIAEQSELQF